MSLQIRYSALPADREIEELYGYDWALQLRQEPSFQNWEVTDFRAPKKGEYWVSLPSPYGRGSDTILAATYTWNEMEKEKRLILGPQIPTRSLATGNPCDGLKIDNVWWTFKGPVQEVAKIYGYAWIPRLETQPAFAGWELTGEFRPPSAGDWIVPVAIGLKEEPQLVPWEWAEPRLIIRRLLTSDDVYNPKVLEELESNSEWESTGVFCRPQAGQTYWGPTGIPVTANDSNFHPDDYRYPRLILRRKTLDSQLLKIYGKTLAQLKALNLGDWDCSKILRIPEQGESWLGSWPTSVNDIWDWDRIERDAIGWVPQPRLILQKSFDRKVFEIYGKPYSEILKMEFGEYELTGELLKPENTISSGDTVGWLDSKALRPNICPVVKMTVPRLGLRRKPKGWWLETCVVTPAQIYKVMPSVPLGWEIIEFRTPNPSEEYLGRLDLVCWAGASWNSGPRFILGPKKQA